MDLPALACTSNLHKPHQNKNHSLIKALDGYMHTQNDVVMVMFLVKLKVYASFKRVSYCS